MQQSSRTLSKLTLTFFALLLPLAAFWQRWTIYDDYRLHNYSPSSQVSQLATDTTMSNTGRHLFYVYHPVLSDKDSFRQHCATAEQTIVLGCYISFNGIYLQNITDVRLTGVQQVTAAHEMLHAAYERLDPSEKKHIGDLLNARFATLNDDRIKSTIEDYKKQKADVTNELHSILPTEVQDLSPELETYYKRYFTDRQKIVSYSEQYESAFTSRKAQVAAYDQQLQDLKQEIDSLNTTLDQENTELKARQAEMDRLLAQNKVDQYNAAIPAYNGLVQTYNGNVQRVRSLIDTYNDIVKKRNDIALEEGELVKAIDSRPATVQTQQ